MESLINMVQPMYNWPNPTLPAPTYKPSNSFDKTKGAKYDKDKPRYDLIPPTALEEFVKVLTFGAKKYAPDNWRLVPEGRRRYFAAAQRHIWAYKRGEQFDEESGTHHLACAITDLMFILEKELLNEQDLKEQV